MKLYNNDKNKRKFQSFVNFTKKMKIIFRTSLFIKRPYNILLVTFIMSQHVKIAKHIECMHQKLTVKTCSL